MYRDIVAIYIWLRYYVQPHTYVTGFHVNVFWCFLCQQYDESTVYSFGNKVITLKNTIKWTLVLS